MAETVIISSPSYSLNVSEPVPTIPTPVKKTARLAPSAAAKHAQKASETTGVAKRKQSKSRNGTLLTTYCPPLSVISTFSRHMLMAVDRLHHLQEQASQVR
jgi:hypothetical protein